MFKHLFSENAPLILDHLMVFLELAAKTGYNIKVRKNGTIEYRNYEDIQKAVKDYVEARRVDSREDHEEKLNRVTTLFNLRERLKEALDEEKSFIFDIKGIKQCKSWEYLISIANKLARGHKLVTQKCACELRIFEVIREVDVKRTESPLPIKEIKLLIMTLPEWPELREKVAKLALSKLTVLKEKLLATLTSKPNWLH